MLALADSEVAAGMRAARGVVVAEAVALGQIRLHEQVAVAAIPAELAARADLAEAARADVQVCSRCAGTRWRDEVEGTAEHARAQPVGQVAAVDLDRLGLGGIGKTDHIRAIGAIDRQAIAQCKHATLDRVLLQARAADLDAWLVVAAKETLHDHAGRHRQCARQGRIGAIGQLRGGDQVGTAGQCIDALREQVCRCTDDNQFQLGRPGSCRLRQGHTRACA